MDSITLATTEQLRAWLSKHSYFEESFCLSIVPAPSASSPASIPDTIVFELAQQIDGGWKIGDVRVLQVFRCTARDVRDWKPGSDPDPSMPDPVEVFEVENGLGIDLDLHGRLACGYLMVEQLPNRTIPIEPRPSASSVFVDVPTGSPPSPREWIQWFAAAGLDVVWRVYGGDEVRADELPVEDYSGFLQRRPVIDSTRSGVFVDVRNSKAGGFSIILSGPMRGEQDATLWQRAREILLRFPDAQFETGDFVLNSGQWENYVRDGKLDSWPFSRRGAK